MSTWIAALPAAACPADDRFHPENGPAFKLTTYRSRDPQLFVSLFLHRLSASVTLPSSPPDLCWCWELQFARPTYARSFHSHSEQRSHAKSHIFSDRNEPISRGPPGSQTKRGAPFAKMRKQSQFPISTSKERSKQCNIAAHQGAATRLHACISPNPLQKKMTKQTHLQLRDRRRKTRCGQANSNLIAARRGPPSPIHMPEIST